MFALLFFRLQNAQKGNQLGIWSWPGERCRVTSVLFALLFLDWETHRTNINLVLGRRQGTNFMFALLALDKKRANRT